ncbi:MAG: acetyltransferase [Agathobacter sp.]|nr:acetyltransferase [Agathobacter sp.]
MDIVMVGSAGCMRELSWQILEDNSNQWNIVGYVDVTGENGEIEVAGYTIPYIGDDNYLLSLDKDVNVVISVGNPYLRKQIYRKYKINKHIKFPSIILKSANVCKDLIFGEGCIITMGAVISTNVSIGDFVFMNTGSMVCHDCTVGDFVTFGPRSQIAGAVCVGANTEICMNATVIQCLDVGKDVVIGAGAVVINNIEDNCTVVGVPARKVVK